MVNPNTSWRSYNTGGKIEDVVTELELRIKKLEARLSVIEPQIQLMEQYPALKNAYSEYKLVEKLIVQQGK